MNTSLNFTITVLIAAFEANPRYVSTSGKACPGQAIKL